MTEVVHSLVVPVYRNEETIPELLDAIEEIRGALDGELEAVFVVDGSPDNCEALLRSQLPDQRYPSLLIVLSRNFGSFAAIRSGLEAARGRFFAVMAADLQEPPDLVVRFFELLAADEADVVVGERRERADPMASKLGSSLFWRFYCRFIQPEMPAGGIDVFGCSAVVRDALVSMRESNSSLVGLLVWSGYRREGVPYDRLPRAVGTSGWTFRKKVRYMFDSAFSFTDLPIRMLLAIGVVGVVLSTAIGVGVFGAWLLGRIDVPGYTPLMLVVLFVGALTVFGLGVIGSYVWRAYENTKQRPLSLVRSADRYGG